MIRIGQAPVEVAGPAVSGIERNVAGADEEGDGGKEDEADGEGGAIVEELKTNKGIEEKSPDAGDDSTKMDSGKSLDAPIR